MKNPAERVFSAAVWQEALRQYELDCGGKLWQAPELVQAQYKELARIELRDYLARSGNV